MTYRQEEFIKRIFREKTLSDARVILFVFLSLLLIFCDRKLNFFLELRTAIVYVTLPLQQVVNWPLEAGHEFLANFIAKRLVLKENSELRTKILLTEARLQRNYFLERENAQLYKLLHVTKQLKTKFLVAQLQSVLQDGFKRRIIINRGQQENLYVGQPIVDAHGLFGQVVLVGAKDSEVLLITDVTSAIPVMIVRNGIQAIAAGNGRGLELLNTPETADIQVGDFLVTSGVQQYFPLGYAVGVVSSVQHISGERFVKILVTPSAHLDSSRNVLLLWSDPV